MSKTSERRKRQQQRIAAQRKSGRAFAIALVGLVALGTIVAIATRKNEDVAPRSAEPAAEVIERSGEAAALGVEVDAQTVALGHVPLDTTVTPTWTLTNTSKEEVSFGEAHAEVVEGCCPGPLAYGSKTLAPGESTELTFPLQMHAGMDGPHEFAVHVPVMRGGEEALLTLTTTGDFSG